MIDERDEFVCLECEERLKDHDAVTKHVQETSHHDFKGNKNINLRLCVG